MISFLNSQLPLLENPSNFPAHLWEYSSESKCSQDRMSVRKLTMPLAGLFAFAVLPPVLYCLYVNAAVWSILAAAVSVTASTALWRISMNLAGRAAERCPMPEPGHEADGTLSDDIKKLLDELDSARAQAEETEKKLKRTISELEEFALLAIRRELKMQELRERFVELTRDHGIKRDFPE